MIIFLYLETFWLLKIFDILFYNSCKKWFLSALKKLHLNSSKNITTTPNPARNCRNTTLLQQSQILLFRFEFLACCPPHTTKSLSRAFQQRAQRQSAAAAPNQRRNKTFQQNETFTQAQAQSTSAAALLGVATTDDVPHSLDFFRLKSLLTSLFVREMFWLFVFTLFLELRFAGTSYGSSLCFSERPVAPAFATGKVP